MLYPRQRFPSRGSVARRPASRRQMGAMLPPPPETPGQGKFRDAPGPIQDIVGTVIGELRTSMLDAATALRLGDTSSKPRYFGTILAAPQALLSPSEVNEPGNIQAGVANAGNAPQMENKTASGAPRIARSLPLRPR